MHFIFYGPEGSGKGTQAKLLAEKLKLPLYTSGDLVRDAAKNDKGEIGDAARAALSEGKYVPDKEMYILWENKLKSKEAEAGFILDGFPRTIRQAGFLSEKTGENNYRIDKLIYLYISDEEALKRLTKRARKLFEGSDINHDDPVRVKQRLNVYRREEKEIVAYYQKKGIILKVDGVGDVQEIFGRILKGLSLE